MLQPPRCGSHAKGGSRTVGLHHSFPLRPGHGYRMYGQTAMRLRRGGNSLRPGTKLRLRQSLRSGAKLRLRQFLRSRTKLRLRKALPPKTGLRLRKALSPQAGLLLHKALRTAAVLQLRPDAGSGADTLRYAHYAPRLSLRTLSLRPRGRALCASLQQTPQPQLRMRLTYPFPGIPYRSHGRLPAPVRPREASSPPLCMGSGIIGKTPPGFGGRFLWT